MWTDDSPASSFLSSHFLSLPIPHGQPWSSTALLSAAAQLSSSGRGGCQPTHSPGSTGLLVRLDWHSPAQHSTAEHSAAEPPSTALEGLAAS